MIKPQRIVIAIGLALTIAMLLFPPWRFVYDAPPERHSAGRNAFGTSWPSSSPTYRGKEHVERAAGYRFLFNQDVPNSAASMTRLFNRDADADEMDLRYLSIRIDSQRLMIQLGVILLTVVGLYWLLQSKSRQYSYSAEP